MSLDSQKKTNKIFKKISKKMKKDKEFKKIQDDLKMIDSKNAGSVVVKLGTISKKGAESWDYFIDDFGDLKKDELEIRLRFWGIEMDRQIIFDQSMQEMMDEFNLSFSEKFNF